MSQLRRQGVGISREQSLISSTAVSGTGGSLSHDCPRGPFGAKIPPNFFPPPSRRQPHTPHVRRIACAQAIVSLTASSQSILLGAMPFRHAASAADWRARPICVSPHGRGCPPSQMIIAVYVRLNSRPGRASNDFARWYISAAPPNIFGSPTRGAACIPQHAVWTRSAPEPAWLNFSPQQ